MFDYQGKVVLITGDREKTGRICCRIAKEAGEVHRVVCGLGTVIKHG